MQSKTRIVDIGYDYISRKTILTLELVNPELEELEKLQGIELNLNLKKWHKPRSLDSNGYAWKLLGLLAEKLDTSAYELYEHYLREQPKLYEDKDGKHITVTIPASVPISEISIRPKDGSEGLHWLFYKSSTDGRFNSYIRIRGSSSFDSAEMTHFIANIVFDCKEQGVDTETPDEIARLKALWGK